MTMATPVEANTAGGYMLHLAKGVCPEGVRDAEAGLRMSAAGPVKTSFLDSGAERTRKPEQRRQAQGGYY